MSRHFAVLIVIPLLGGAFFASPPNALAGDVRNSAAASSQQPSCGAPGPAIWPVRSAPYGRSYEYWASAWWQWGFSVPSPSNPLLDTTGEACMVGQQGRVWNLAGLPGAGAETRRCDVPCDRALFF